MANKQRLIELLKEKRVAIISHTVTKGLNPDVSMKESGVEWIGKIRTLDCRSFKARFRCASW